MADVAAGVSAAQQGSWLLPGLGPRACIWAHVHDVLYRLTRELEGDENPECGDHRQPNRETGVNLRWVSSLGFGPSS